MTGDSRGLMLAATRLFRGFRDSQDRSLALRRRMTRKPRAHCLHIRKTGGSATKAALLPVEFAGPRHICLHPHTWRLEDIPVGDQFFFGVRDPVARFVSGFCSRYRQGSPPGVRPWTKGERRAFRTFATANDLAVALSSDDAALREAAENAMGSILHLHSYWTWFGTPEYLRLRSRDILMILFQERLNSDFRILTKLLEVDASLPEDDFAAHRNQLSVDRDLSALATANLKHWYARDYEFLELCRELRSESEATLERL